MLEASEIRRLDRLFVDHVHEQPLGVDIDNDAARRRADHVRERHAIGGASGPRLDAHERRRERDVGGGAGA